MDDLVAFLTAMLDADEVAAKGAAVPNDENGGGEIWEVSPAGGVDGAHGPVYFHDGGIPTAEQDAHIARHDPARVLAEVAAKRAILAEFEEARGLHSRRDEVAALYFSLRQLAAVYATHPAYRPEWKP